MKMTALQFVTQFLIQKLKSLSSEEREGVLEVADFENWIHFLFAVEENENDIVEWIITELGRWKRFEEFNFEENIIDDGFKSGEGDFCVFELGGKLIKVSYSEKNPKSYCYDKIEFDFVEQVEILVPKKIWQIKNH